MVFLEFLERQHIQVIGFAQTSGATFHLTGVQVEKGSQATPFEHEPYSVTLAKCRRYFQDLL